mgnify:CR=1 FL=1
MKKEKEILSATYLSFFGNLILAIIKALAGYFGNSHALIADSIESGSDVFSSLMVYFGMKYSIKPADKNHPYGHGRIEPLITFLIVIFLVISATIIAYESVYNIQNHQKMPEAWTLYILGGIILWKEISFRIIIRKNDLINSSMIKADAWHHRSDAITSLSAFIGISIAIAFGEGYETADDWAALFSSGIILYNGYLIFRPALGEIMDENLHNDLVHKIREVSRNVNGIIGTEKCFIRKSGHQFYVDLHAIVDGTISVEQGHLLSHELKDTLKLHIPSIENVLVHIEPNNEINK